MLGYYSNNCWKQDPPMNAKQWTRWCDVKQRPFTSVVSYRICIPSLTPGAYSNSRPLSQWCHPTISSYVISFSSCLQYLPASGSFFFFSGSFQMSQFYETGGQSIGVSSLTSVLKMNIQDCFPLGWNGWISLLFKDSQESSPTPQSKSIHSSALRFLYSPTLPCIHGYWKQPQLWLNGPLLAK